MYGSAREVEQSAVTEAERLRGLVDLRELETGSWTVNDSRTTLSRMPQSKPVVSMLHSNRARALINLIKSRVKDGL